MCQSYKLTTVAVCCDSIYNHLLRTSNNWKHENRQFDLETFIINTTMDNDIQQKADANCEVSA